MTNLALWQRAIEEAAKQVPTTWLDPLLTGPTVPLARAKCDELMTKPHYPGEEYTAASVPEPNSPVSAPKPNQQDDPS